MTLKTTDIAWVAGILEGEGCIENSSVRSFPRIYVAMTDLDVVIRFAEIVGAKAVRTRTNNSGVKQQWAVRLAGPRAIQWLMSVYCLMGERRQGQIRKSIEMWKANKQRRPGNRLLRSENTIVWQRLPAGARAA